MVAASEMSDVETMSRDNPRYVKSVVSLFQETSTNLIVDFAMSGGFFQ